MPGMMDTILNLGLSDVATEGLAKKTGNERFAFDSYRRLVQMYGEVVDGIDAHRFEQRLTDMKQAKGVQQDTDLDADDLRGLVGVFKAIYEEETGSPFPQDARDQLTRAVRGVFESWDNPRAQVYRRAHDIPDDLGTAVNVMQMVFGNKGDTSATGVCFTRDPGTGEQGLYGEFLPNAQGEDVVAGIRTPLRLEQMQETLPDAFDQLVETMAALERHYRDMQDIEFTVEDGKLFLLQTRSAKRTAAAALKAAVAMVDEGLITREEAVARIDPASLDQLLHPRIDPNAQLEAAAKGLNASPGAACGGVVFDADTAAERGGAGEAVILVRWETTPDDIHGMIAAQGILTVHGGMTSHAAVVARGMGKPCVAGAEGVTIDVQAKTAQIGGTTVHELDPITLDGGTGQVYIGKVDLVPPQINEDFETVLTLGRRLPAAQGQGQRGHARGRREGTRVRRGGDRPLPHRAHVLRRGAPAARAGDDHGRGRTRQAGRARPAAADAAVRLRGDLRGDGRPAGHDPAARSAAARVPARGGGRARRQDAPAHPRAPRVEPDARHARLPPRDHVPGDVRDAGARDRARRARGERADRGGAARRDHASARRLRRGAAPAARADRAHGRGGGRRSSTSAAR